MHSSSAAYTEYTDKIREALDSADYEDPWLADEGRAALSKLIAEIERLRANQRTGRIIHGDA